MVNANAIYNCIIIDDDEIDRLTILSYARRYDFLNICGIFSSAVEALKLIEKTDVKVILTDIDMPGINGMEFRRKMLNIPVCIFVTSFPDYAVESFELAALDFLVKPIKAERFDTAMVRLKEYLDAKQKANLYEYSLGADTVFVKEGHKHIKVKLHEIIYLEALKDYTLIAVAGKKYCVHSPISNLLKEDHFKTFIRIHRSYAVQKHMIESINPTMVKVKNNTLPIGRAFKDNLEFVKV